MVFVRKNGFQVAVSITAVVAAEFVWCPIVNTNLAEVEPDADNILTPHV